MSYTKGEWTVDSDKMGHPDRAIFVATTQKTICKLNRADAEAEANARLMAAAPKLLQACKDVLWEFEHKTQIAFNEQCEQHCIAQLKAVIAEAESEVENELH